VPLITVQRTSSGSARPEKLHSYALSSFVTTFSGALEGAGGGKDQGRLIRHRRTGKSKEKSGKKNGKKKHKPSFNDQDREPHTNEGAEGKRVQNRIKRKEDY